MININFIQNDNITHTLAFTFIIQGKFIQIILIIYCKFFIKRYTNIKILQKLFKRMINIYFI